MATKQTKPKAATEANETKAKAPKKEKITAEKVLNEAVKNVSENEEIKSLVEQVDSITPLTDEDIKDASNEEELKSVLNDKIEEITKVEDKISDAINKINDSNPNVKKNLTYIWNGQNFSM